jgi:hypothetical protein
LCLLFRPGSTRRCRNSGQPSKIITNTAAIPRLSWTGVAHGLLVRRKTATKLSHRYRPHAPSASSLNFQYRDQLLEPFLHSALVERRLLEDPGRSRIMDVENAEIAESNAPRVYNVCGASPRQAPHSWPHCAVDRSLSCRSYANISRQSPTGSLSPLACPPIYFAGEASPRHPQAVGD